MSFFQATGPECKIESYPTRVTQKTDCFSVDDYCIHCKTGFEAIGCFFHFFFVKKLELDLLMIISSEELRKGCFREKIILDRRSVVL